MKKKSLTFLLSTVFIFSLAQQKENRLIDNVNIFTGTSGLNHCFPGATVPFGMVQLSPDTDVTRAAHQAGYQYGDSSIMGFSHTHLSGTGPGSMLDILVMPTVGELKTTPGSAENPDEGFRSRFKKDSEMAWPGYYGVTLDDYNINVGLTTTRRCGFHEYTFPGSNQSNIIIDLGHHNHSMGERVLHAFIEVVNDTLVRGYHITTGWWVENRFTYFVAAFSKPFKSHAISLNGDIYNGKNQQTGKDVKAYVTFNTKKDEKLLAKVGISPVSMEGAMKNLQAEIPHWDFNKTRKEAEIEWEKQLSKIQVESDDQEQKTIFYTALYHSCLGPYLFSDVDGSYRSVNWDTYRDTTYEFYSTFSIWDTYRATHPLFTIIERDRTTDFVKSLLDMRDQHWNKMLPIWPLGGSESYCMIGYHAASIIAEAHAKGIGGFDEERAYNALYDQAMNKNYRYLEFYDQFGFIPYDLEHPNIKNERLFMDLWAYGDWSSRTLEYSYDDYCVASMAKSLGKTDNYQYLKDRSKNYENLFHAETGVFAPRSATMEWYRNFDPYSWAPGFTESLPIQYTFAMQHDIQGYINLLGSYESFIEILDGFFTKKNPHESHHWGGKIGYYSHANEPGHHTTYLYNYAGKPWMTQYRVRQITDTMYVNEPEGFPGNDDMGQMSAWYVLSTMGFYPVSPASGNYVIGSPSFRKVVINLENGNQFTIMAKNTSKENIYIQSCKVNGKPVTKTWFNHSLIQNGGKIEFVMDNKPNKNWGVNPEDFPPSVSEAELNN